MSGSGAPLDVSEEPAAVVALVHGIVAGDPAAEAEMVQRYSRGVRFLLRHLTRAPEVVDDLHQETFVLALEKLRRGELRDASKLPEFLRGIARNLARSAGRGTRFHELDAAGLEVVDGAKGPLRSLLLREEIELTRRALEDLPSPRDRQVLWQFCVAEQDKGEICHDLGLSSTHFNLVLFRARRRFRTLFEEAIARSQGIRKAEDPERS